MVSTKGQLSGSTCYCTKCNRYFSSVGSFDAHFRSSGEGVENPQHMNPLKLKKPMAPVRRTPDGSAIWGVPIPPEMREKMQKMWAAKKAKSDE